MTEASTSPRFQLPLLVPGQAQAHPSLNKALLRLDQLAQLTVESRSRAAPPAAPLAGQCYIVAAGASGAWAGQSGRLALATLGAPGGAEGSAVGWEFVAPQPGQLAHVVAEDRLVQYRSGAWTRLGTVEAAQLAVQAGVTAGSLAVAGDGNVGGRLQAGLFRSGSLSGPLADTGTSLLDVPLGLTYGVGQIALIGLSSSALNHEINARTEAALMWTGIPTALPLQVYGNQVGGSMGVTGLANGVLRVAVTNNGGSTGTIGARWLLLG